MSDEWVMVPREASEAMIRAGYSAPTVFGVRDMANTYRAMLAAAPDASQRNREADRARYIDRAFNEWLDDSVADGGATVWDLVPDIHSAWAAWTAHPHYAAPQQAEPVAWMAFGGALVHAVTRNAMDPIEAERFDVPLYLHPPAAPQQAEPAAQIGWADEFGNLFPMGAWKPAQRTHHDSHKTAWRPVFLHPPAEPQQAEPVAWAVFDPSGEAIYAALFKTRCVEYVDNEYRYGHGAAKHWAVRPAFAHPPAAEVQRLREAARDVCEWADAAQWALGNETGVPAAKLDALRRVLEGGE